MHKERKVPRRGTKPAIGASVVRGDVRIIVQAGMSDELWLWLLDQGWREVVFQPDRRTYRDVPAAWVTRLVDSPPEMTARVLDAAIEHAAVRPSLRASAPARAPVRKRR